MRRCAHLGPAIAHEAEVVGDAAEGATGGASDVARQVRPQLLHRHHRMHLPSVLLTPRHLHAGIQAIVSVADWLGGQLSAVLNFLLDTPPPPPRHHPQRPVDPPSKPDATILTPNKWSGPTRDQSCETSYRICMHLMHTKLQFDTITWQPCSSDGPMVTGGCDGCAPPR